MLLGVSVGLVVAGLPLMNKVRQGPLPPPPLGWLSLTTRYAHLQEVYRREQAVAQMRDDSYDASAAKNAARDARLKRS